MNESMKMVQTSGLSRLLSLGRTSVWLAVSPSASCLLALAMGLTAGCSGHPPIVEPAFSPTEAAQRAIAQYDKNGDGNLDAKELEDCPALLSVLKELDTNKDGKLSAEEIAKRLQGFQESHIGLLGINCRVKLDDAPLAGATVTLVPEAFLGNSFKPAKGVSDETGFVQLVTEGQEVAGVAFGYYRIEVSKKDGGGNETLPARYNTRTTLGKEVSPLARSGMAISLNLTGS